MALVSRWQIAALALAPSILLTGCASTPLTAPTASTPTSTRTSANPVATPAMTDDVATDEPVMMPTPTGGASVAEVTLRITTWGVDDGVFSAAGVVAGVASDAGECHMVLERGSQRITATGSPARSASSTDCAQGLTVPVADLTAGTWDMTLTYESPGFAGTSDTVEVII